MVEKLAHEEVDNIIIKAHPNSTYQGFSENLPKDPRVIFIATEYNSRDLS